MYVANLIDEPNPAQTLQNKPVRIFPFMKWLPQATSWLFLLICFCLMVFECTFV